MIAEIWKPIKGYQYEVSSRGRVRSPRRVRQLNQHRDGHLQVTLHRKGKRKTFFVHTLVLEAFIGPRPKGLQCRHLDGDPTNNWATNLQWGTQAENYDDRRKHGTCCSGVRHGRARLTWESVEEIRRRYKDGETQQAIADDFGTAQSRISEIVTYKTWRNR